MLRTAGCPKIGDSFFEKNFLGFAIEDILKKDKSNFQRARKNIPLHEVCIGPAIATQPMEFLTRNCFTTASSRWPASLTQNSVK